MIPFDRLGVIFWNSLAGLVEDTQIELRCGVSLFGGFAKPFCRLPILLRHALTGLITETQITLRHRIVLFGGTAKPFDGFLKILRHALAGLITDSQITLRFRIALVGGGPHFIKRLPRFAIGSHENRVARSWSGSLCSGVSEPLLPETIDLTAANSSREWRSYSSSSLIAANPSRVLTQRPKAANAQSGKAATKLLTTDKHGPAATGASTAGEHE
jgi:hypothetical protein